MALEIKNISYTYAPDTPFEHKALDDVTLTVKDGEFLAVAGHTGSGKSTLMQMLNGLLTPRAGEIIVDGVDINPKNTKNNFAAGQAAKTARRKVGLVFQYPEQQLFEETVFADVAFGARKQGLNEDEVTLRVKDALKFVRLDFDKFRDKSPFNLSGGEMRRVAIAGIIAMRPKYLALDEPTAGLDPMSRLDLMKSVVRYQKETKSAVILVAHSMSTIAEYADRMAVFGGGKLLFCGKPKEVFAQREILNSVGLKPPPITRLINRLRSLGLNIAADAVKATEGAEAIARAVKKL